MIIPDVLTDEEVRIIEVFTLETEGELSGSDFSLGMDMAERELLVSCEGMHFRLTDKGLCAYVGHYQQISPHIRERMLKEKRGLPRKGE